MFWDVEYTSGLFVMYALFLFLYHYRASEKFNTIFFIYVIAMMFTEIGFLHDFEKYIVITTFLFIISQMCFLWLLRPILKVNIKSFSTHNLAEFVIGFIGISYVVGYIYYLIFPLVPDLPLFLSSTIAYLITVIICLGVPFFNKHPDNAMLWGIGGGIIAEMSCAFIYEYVSDHRAYLVMAHIFGAFFKIVFATYILRIKDIKETESDYN